MNRRDFAKLFGVSLTSVAFSSHSNYLSSSDSIKISQLKRFRQFWFANFAQTPEDYLVSENIKDEQSFKQKNTLALKNQTIIEFEGMYYSHYELALLASLSPVAV